MKLNEYIQPRIEIIDILLDASLAAGLTATKNGDPDLILDSYSTRSVSSDTPGSQFSLSNRSSRGRVIYDE